MSQCVLKQFPGEHGRTPVLLQLLLTAMFDSFIKAGVPPRRCVPDRVHQLSSAFWGSDESLRSTAPEILLSIISMEKPFAYQKLAIARQLPTTRVREWDLRASGNIATKLLGAFFLVMEIYSPRPTMMLKFMMPGSAG